LSSARPDSTNCFPARPNSRPMHSRLIASDGNCIGLDKGHQPPFAMTDQGRAPK
jgi:hypothetical protein